jgi:hypothetical protein
MALNNRKQPRAAFQIRRCTMKKTLIFLVALAIASPFARADSLAPCIITTLASLESEPGCAVGSLDFTHFDLQNLSGGPRTPMEASQILVTPTPTGLNFSFTTTRAVFLYFYILYSVEVADGGGLISGTTLSLAGSGYGVVGWTECLGPGNVSSPPMVCSEPPIIGDSQQIVPGELLQSTLRFDGVSVMKMINTYDVLDPFGQHVSVSATTDFSQVPEPATLALMTANLLMISLMRRGKGLPERRR